MFFYTDTCTITSLSPTTLTATGGEIASGTMNVTIQCSCTDSDGEAINSIRWYDPDGTRLVSSENRKFNATVPHFERVNNTDDDVILIIPIFSDYYDGTYTCGGVAGSVASLGSPNASVTLIGELIINKSLILYVAIYWG